MRTHDPFLRHLLSVLDRTFVWAVLTVVLTGLAWTATWERGLGLPVLDGWRVLASAVLGRETDRTTLTLLALCGAIGMAAATVIGGWLFRRWQRRAALNVVRLRGARWENDK